MNETTELVGLLRERDRLKAELAANSRALKPTLAKWGASRPGAIRGATTEHGARFILRQGGVL